MLNWTTYWKGKKTKSKQKQTIVTINIKLQNQKYKYCRVHGGQVNYPDPIVMDGAVNTDLDG